jgi:phage gp29-like protein
MKQDDLAPFAVAEGLLGRIQQNPTGMTDQERQTLLDRAREVLARTLGKTLDEAGKLMFQAADEGEFTVQAGNEFACVMAWGRVLYVANRTELRGACHPERN